MRAYSGSDLTVLQKANGYPSGALEQKGVTVIEIRPRQKTSRGFRYESLSGSDLTVLPES